MTEPSIPLHAQSTLEGLALTCTHAMKVASIYVVVSMHFGFYVLFGVQTGPSGFFNGPSSFSV